MSADSTVIVGSSRSNGSTPTRRAFRWTSAGGMQLLHNFGAQVSSEATSLNADGTVIVGNVIFENISSVQIVAGFHWTAETGGQRPPGHTRPCTTHEWNEDIDRHEQQVAGIEGGEMTHEERRSPSHGSADTESPRPGRRQR